MTLIRLRIEKVVSILEDQNLSMSPTETTFMFNPFPYQK